MGYDTAFVPVTASSTLRKFGLGAKAEVKRASRERAARRAGWRPPPGGSLSVEPVLARDAYPQGDSTSWPSL